jgi:sigma-B regulation protein RsbU (phosphoserine phosphatase)
MSGIPYKKASVELEPYSEMFIYSDGVYEVNKPDGSMLERDEFIEKLSEPLPQPSALQHIYRYVRDLQNSDNFQDDYSILQVRFS